MWTPDGGSGVAVTKTLAEDHRSHPAADYATRWDMGERMGRIVHDDPDGWRIEFRTVRWPNERKPRRVRIFSVPLLGRLESERECEKTLKRIRSKVADGEDLHAVLDWYLPNNAPQNLFLTRWGQFCDH